MTRIGLSLLTLLFLLFLPFLAHAQEPDEGNVNTRYTIHRVDITGIDETRISQALRDELQALVGGRVDDERIDRLKERLVAELPEFHVNHRVSRGDEPGQLRIDFNFRRTEESRWLHFAPMASKVVYHGEQGWSTLVEPIQGSGTSGRFGLGFAWKNNDDLVEEYTGVSFAFENVEAGTKRLGLGLRLSRYTQKWNAATLTALELNLDVPAVYRRRFSVQPTVSFAANKHVRFTAGAMLAELDPVESASDSQRVNAALAEVGFYRGAKGDAGHHVEASYQVRAGASALDSDLVYKRHFAQVQYRLGSGRSHFRADLLLGRITGRAPLFERFTLGDTSTLRGWNKYDLAPIGANRVVHQSVEFRHHRLAYFVDAGAVWSEREDVRVRLSSGVGFHAQRAFLTIGVPLNADKFAGTVMLGMRF